MTLLNVLNVLNVLNALNVLNVLKMFKDPSLACWALFTIPLHTTEREEIMMEESPRRTKRR